MNYVVYFPITMSHYRGVTYTRLDVNFDLITSLGHEYWQDGSWNLKVIVLGFGFRLWRIAP